MNQQRNILLKGLAAIAAVIVICVSIRKLIGIGSETLGDIAREYPQPTATPRASSEPHSESEVSESDDTAYPIESTTEPDNTMTAENPLPPAGGDDKSLLAGASLNGDLMAYARITLEDGFYYEPLSEDLAEYITGVSYPESVTDPAVTFMDLSYVHVLYCDFEGESAEGELICNQSIAHDLVEIFRELYLAGYQIEKLRLID
ncbi:MAG: hypothetical protein K2K19_08510, partial [Acetatifactor sp.]|nr:hypothetical protein [Acetatifactor sp.]